MYVCQRKLPVAESPGHTLFGELTVKTFSSTALPKLGYVIAKRTIHLDQTVLAANNLSIFF